jgi:DnaJ-class molecular chaperone
MMGAAMYDFSQPNDAPGTCCKCHGTGTYHWGAVVNGVPGKSGTCFSCRGTGKQSSRQIRRNRTYNRFKVAEIVRADFVRDPGEDAADRWNETHGDRWQP